MGIDVQNAPPARRLDAVGGPTQKICVVLVIDDLGYGGAERQVVELANHSDASRFDVHVCSLSNHVPLGAELIEMERKLHVVRMTRGFDFTAALRLAHLLKTLRADIVHGFLLRGQITSRLAGRLAGTPVIVGSERGANYPVKRIHKVICRLTRACVDVIIANSDAGARFNSRIFGLSSSNYRLVRNGIDTERFRPADGRKMREELGIPAQCPVVGVFANLKEAKNHAMLFRAFRLLLDSFPEARLLLVGAQPVDARGRQNGYREEMDRLIDDLGIRHRCMFLGHRKDVQRLYPACDITALSSSHEGTPNVLLESMACGIPVIATNVCDNAYIVREGEVGHLVALGDETAMARQMKLLLGDSALRRKMGEKARAWVLEEFSNRRLAQKTEGVYMELLRTKLKDFRQAANS